MIFEGYIVRIDGDEMNRLCTLANNIANNINQITVRVNSIRKVMTVCNGKREVWEDYEEAKAYFFEMMMSTIRTNNSR